MLDVLRSLGEDGSLVQLLRRLQSPELSQCLLTEVLHGQLRVDSLFDAVLSYAQRRHGITEGVNLVVEIIAVPFLDHVVGRLLDPCYRGPR